MPVCADARPRLRCAFDEAAADAATGEASTRGIAAAMNCALMSHCPARDACLDRLFILLNHLGRQDSRDRGA